MEYTLYTLSSIDNEWHYMYDAMVLVMTTNKV
jgi:hypothetical protein